MKNRIVVLPLLMVVLSWSTSRGDHHVGFVSLFDGETLDGWSQRNGTATYRVDNGTIVGTTSEGSPNSFLCTDQLYGDFELKFEVRCDVELNSGVQIRSQSKGDTPEGRVNGPQVEIAAGDYQGSLAGYVYGEAAGGWMTPDGDRVPHHHYKGGQWNSYRVLAFGSRIQVWINGQRVSDLVHEEKRTTHPKGFIGLQVHGIAKGTGPYQVAWRNIELRDLSGYETLYNGNDLSGWTTTGNWLPQEDGSLLIQPRPGEEGWQRYAAYLWSDKRYKDFVLDVEYAYPSGGNSGIFFRVGDLKDPVNTGIEAQILDSSETEGPLGHHDHGGIIRHVGACKNMSRPPHEWNHMVITCIGSQLTVDLNGEQVIDTRLDEGELADRPLEGHVGLQDHGEPNNIRFRNIRIKEL